MYGKTKFTNHSPVGDLNSLYYVLWRILVQTDFFVFSHSSLPSENIVLKESPSAFGLSPQRQFGAESNIS